MAAIGAFLKDVFTDLKSSRRFQVATVLWIPLFVTAFILFVRFSIINAVEEKYHEWKHTLVPINTINFPNAYVHFLNPLNAAPICTQPWGSNPRQQATYTTAPCSYENSFTCYTFQFSAFQSSGLDLFQYAIQCNFTFNAGTGNDIIDMRFPGGFATTPDGLWQRDPLPVRPNAAVAIHLEPEHYFPMHGSKIEAWRERVHYESTQFTESNTLPYAATLYLRIPYTMINAHWEQVGVDSWVLMSLWGGGFFFFYFLHSIAFGIAKFFLPNDSKLLRVPESAEYTPIK